jgi:predicted HicB family RNase H-like nuclease
MMTRCHNPEGWGYDEYGAKGVTVCERWHDFRNFLYDMGERPAGKSIDRIDGSRGYEPGNCRWATRSQQNANRRKYIIVNKNPNQGRSRGRPPLPPEQRESQTLNIRVSEERKSQYEGAATKAKKTLSAWIKGVLDRASKR